MSDRSTVKPIEILLIEDSPSDADLAIEALGQGKILNNLHFVEDGVEAIKFLRRKAPYLDVPRPDLILLDLHLPKKSGIEVLEEIKNDHNFLPTIFQCRPVNDVHNCTGGSILIKIYVL